MQKIGGFLFIILPAAFLAVVPVLVFASPKSDIGVKIEPPHTAAVDEPAADCRQAIVVAQF